MLAKLPTLAATQTMILIVEWHKYKIHFGLSDRPLRHSLQDISVKWSCNTGQPAKMYPPLVIGYANDDKTVQEIAAKDKIHPTQVTTWKRQAIDGLAGVFFDRIKRAEDNGAEIKALHAKIGKLAVEDAKIKISMDGRGQYLDNIFAARLWRSLKREAVYLRELLDGFRARRVIENWIL